MNKRIEPNSVHALADPGGGGGGGGPGPLTPQNLRPKIYKLNGYRGFLWK